MRDEVHRDALGLGLIVQLEITARRHTLGLEADGRLLVAVTLDFHLVRGRVNRLDGRVGCQLDLHRETANRLARVLARAQRVGVLDQPPVIAQHLVVRQLDALLAVRLEGENSHLEQPLVRELQQRRILHRAHDVGVNLARLLGVEQFRLDEFAVDFHLEIFNRRALGHWEQKRPLLPAGIGIIKNLLHRRARHAVVDFHRHLLLLQFHRREHVANGPRPRPGRNDNRRPRERRRNDDDIVADN